MGHTIALSNGARAEKWMKCLLCDKCCRDNWSHAGSPGPLNPTGSKDHFKNLRYYDSYKDQVRQDKLGYHTELARFHVYIYMMQEENVSDQCKSTFRAFKFKIDFKFNAWITRHLNLKSAFKFKVDL